MSNALTRQAGAQLGLVALRTLLHHYLDRHVDKNNGSAITQLRQDELLYDEAFNIIKKFLEISTYHPLEDMQALLNTRRPSPPWVNVVRLLVPMPCCDEAAILLTQALGGEEHAKRVVGGTKWWQARGIPGIEAEWIAEKKDWQETKKHGQSSQPRYGSASPPSKVDSGEDAHVPDPEEKVGDTYDQHMDEQRCILYAHGGGYYHGSIDQERHSIQRYARKINGRVFAINYRLAPQYPFPCALQDFLAAYLYLITPPAGASHQPISPSRIVVVGDSAGGGLTLALLQVIRDTGLPSPAGGVLISPWCDLTHSFPSIDTNAATDIVPEYGFTLHKPSVLWPPPSNEIIDQMRNTLRHSARQIVHLGTDGDRVGNHPTLMDAIDTDTISLRTEAGKLLEIDQQMQVYTRNSLLAHPLVSPTFSYLGGLPPLFFIASDKEVLRDEVIYCAHKAAEPSQFPLTAAARNIYPPLVGIEKRYNTTPVHIQVYDDTAHILPVLFGFTTPGKFCHRAIANFVKHVTGSSILNMPKSHGQMVFPSRFVFRSPVPEGLLPTTSNSPMARSRSTNDLTNARQAGHLTTPSTPVSTPSPIPRPAFTTSTFFRIKDLQASVPRTFSSFTTRKRGVKSPPETPVANAPARVHSEIIHSNTVVRFAGEGSVYLDEAGYFSWKGEMIRERISTRGEVRPLEPKEELEALSVPQGMRGVVSQPMLERYLQGKAFFDEKFAKEMQEVEKQRKSYIDFATKDFAKVIRRLEELHGSNSKKIPVQDSSDSSKGSWGLAWALDDDERPPPSSIISRCDVAEARKLARSAIEIPVQGNPRFGGNSFKVTIMNFLSISQEEGHPKPNSKVTQQVVSPALKSKSTFSSLRLRVKSWTPVDDPS